MMMMMMIMHNKHTCFMVSSTDKTMLGRHCVWAERVTYLRFQLLVYFCSTSGVCFDKRLPCC